MAWWGRAWAWVDLTTIPVKYWKSKKTQKTELLHLLFPTRDIFFLLKKKCVYIFQIDSNKDKPLSMLDSVVRPLNFSQDHKDVDESVICTSPGSQAHWQASIPNFSSFVELQITKCLRSKSAWLLHFRIYLNYFIANMYQPILISLEPAQMNCTWEHCKNSRIIRENLFMTYLMHNRLAVFNLEGWRDR